MIKFKKTLLLVFVLVFSCNFFAQNNNKMTTLEGLVWAGGYAFNELWANTPKDYIVIENIKNGESHKTECIIFSYKESLSTIIIMKVHSNLAIIIGYCARITDGKIDGKGEFIYSHRAEGEIKKLNHIFVQMPYIAVDNEKIYYLNNDGFELYAKDQIEVQLIKNKVLGYSYYLPKNYFNWK